MSRINAQIESKDLFSDSMNKIKPLIDSSIDNEDTIFQGCVEDEDEPKKAK